MSASPVAERRQHPRHPLATGVQFSHEPSQKDYPGRCVDISRGGLLMYVPATTPLLVGHTIRLTVGSVGRPEFEVLSEKPVDATVVRVERHSLISLGYIAVGVRFHEKC